MSDLGIQNLSRDAIADVTAESVVATSVEAVVIDLAGDGDFISLNIKWSNGTEAELAIEPHAADLLISELVKAKLRLAPYQATISLADLTGVRIDGAAETVSVDGISGCSEGGTFPD